MSRTAPDGYGYSRCTAWNANGGWVAVATEEGSVEVMRVCDTRETRGEVNTTESLDSNLEHCKSLLMYSMQYI